MAIPKSRKPNSFRRLTKAEASRVGVSYGAKRMVRASVKRVTANTPTISNREASTKAIIRTQRSTGQRKIRSKEAYTKSRAPIIREAKSGGKAETHNNLSKRDLTRLLKINRNRRVVLIIHADRSGKNYKNKGAVWSHGVSQVDAETLLDAESFDEYLKASAITSRPDRYGLEVLPDGD